MENNEYFNRQQPPMQRMQQYGDSAPVMTTMDWVIIMLVLCIPIVNFIMLFVWAFDASGNPNKQNWAKAQLIFAAIGFVLGILFFLAMGTAMFSMLSQMPGATY